MKARVSAQHVALRRPAQGGVFAIAGLLALCLAHAFPLIGHPADAPDVTVSLGAPRIAVLEDGDNPAQRAAREAFLRALELMAHPGATAYFLRDTAITRGNDAQGREAALRLLSRNDVDLILVSGADNLRHLLTGNTPDVLIVALSPDCLETPLSDSPENVLLFPTEFWTRRLEAVQGAMRFQRLGIIAAPGVGFPAIPDIDSPADASSMPGTLFEYFVFDSLATQDAAECREAVDSLFFDEIDALLLDGSQCFSPEKADFAELMELLRIRGILPFSLTDPEAAAHGALLAPWQGEFALFGRDQALAAVLWTPFAAKFGELFAVAFPPDRRPAVRQACYALNTDVAEDAGFTPPFALLAMVREYVRTSTLPREPSGGEKMPE